MITVPMEQYLKDGTGLNWCYDYHRVSTADLNIDLIKADPTLLFGGQVFNNAAYPIYVKLLNVSVVSGAGALRVQKTIGVPAGQSIPIDISSPVLFDRGLGISITKLIADSDVTPILQNDCVIDLHYR